MRTHDHDPEVAPSPPDHVARRDDTPVGSRVAQRVLARDRADALTPEAVLHLQRAAGNAGVGALLDEQQAVTKVAGGGGQPLDPDVRQRMESRFGADFSSVRVHTGSEAAQAARAVQAHAYTVGDDVVFGDGAYQPGTPAGERTLAHELAHVLQQRAGPVDGTDTGAGFRLSSPDDRFERAAEETADRVVAGAPAGDVAAAAPVGVQREAAAPEEEEEPEEAVQGSFVQRQEEPEEEEMPA
jgi:hypothetical protein